MALLMCACGSPPAVVRGDVAAQADVSVDGTPIQADAPTIAVDTDPDVDAPDIQPFDAPANCLPAGADVAYFDLASPKAEVATLPACATVSDCPPADSCHTVQCSDGSCVTAQDPAKPGCCNGLGDTDCNDKNPMTVDYCEFEAGSAWPTCKHDCKGICSLGDTVCNDGNSCTKDVCFGCEVCANIPIANCCVVDCDCDDGDPCTADTCIPAAKLCTFTPGCCPP